MRTPADRLRSPRKPRGRVTPFPVTTPESRPRVIALALEAVEGKEGEGADLRMSGGHRRSAQAQSASVTGRSFARIEPAGNPFLSSASPVAEIV